MYTTMVDFGREAHQQGMIDGMQEVIAAGVAHRQEPRPRAHPEAQVPWTSFVQRFYVSRPGLSESTRTSYEQAFREWKALIGDKQLADLKPRDVGRYGTCQRL